jgi:predicted DNA-binding transcriptional regulator YafY
MPDRVVIRFDPAVVRWVRERQHYTLVTDQPDEANGAIMIYRPRSFDQIESWLLTWGEMMEVLEPPELRRRIAETARRMMSRHQELL